MTEFLQIDSQQALSGKNQINLQMDVQRAVISLGSSYVKNNFIVTSEIIL